MKRLHLFFDLDCAECGKKMDVGDLVNYDEVSDKVFCCKDCFIKNRKKEGVRK